VTRCILAAPIKTMKGELIGGAQALNKRRGRYTKDELTLLEAMITQATVALQSAQFVERMKTFASRRSNSSASSRTCPPRSTCRRCLRKS